jgi:hypothetical protein
MTEAQRQVSLFFFIRRSQTASTPLVSLSASTPVTSRAGSIIASRARLSVACRRLKHSRRTSGPFKKPVRGRWQKVFIRTGSRSFYHQRATGLGFLHTTIRRFRVGSDPDKLPRVRQEPRRWTRWMPHARRLSNRGFSISVREVSGRKTSPSRPYDSSTGRRGMWPAKPDAISLRKPSAAAMSRSSSRTVSGLVSGLP